MLGCQWHTFAVIAAGALTTSYYCSVRFIRNFSLPFLLLGDVLRGHLQHGQIYPSWNKYTSHLRQYFIPRL